VRHNNDVCVVTDTELKTPPRMASFVQMSVRSITIGKGLKIGSVAQEAPGGPETLLEVVLAADVARTALLDEAEHAIWHSGPKGVKALLANLKAGATFLTERAAYYASDAYARAKELAEKALAAGKEGADAAAARAGELGAHAKEAAEAAKARAGELGAQAKEAAGRAAAAAAARTRSSKAWQRRRPRGLRGGLWGRPRRRRRRSSQGRTRPREAPAGRPARARPAGSHVSPPQAPGPPENFELTRKARARDIEQPQVVPQGPCRGYWQGDLRRPACQRAPPA
jgi:hypothetical protein